jgi:hypothetical protein
MSLSVELRVTVCWATCNCLLSYVSLSVELPVTVRGATCHCPSSYLSLSVELPVTVCRATCHSLSIYLSLSVELLVTVCCVKILSAAQNCFCGKFMSLATIKHTQVYMQNARCCTETKEHSCSLADGLFLTNSLAEQIVMTDKSRSFSLSVSVAVKSFTCSDGINRLWSNKH